MNFKRVISAAVSLGLALSLAISSGASVLGDIYYSPTTELSDALDYTQVYAYDAEKDKNTRAYILEYDPSSDETLPLVTCGGSVYGRKTLDTMIGYKLRDASKLAAAMNADFFSMKTGVPMGVVIEGGIVFSGPENENAFVITEDGAASIATADISVSMSVAGKGELDIDYFNKYPTKYGAYLLNSFYGETTTSTLDSREIVMRADADPYITPNGTVSASVTEIRDGVSDSAIPSGCFVLSYAKSGTAGGNKLLASLEKGDKITFTSRCTGLPENVRLAVGGGDVILRGGVYDEKLADEEHETLRNPRTAVGVRADGTVVFFACDGRRAGFSDGLTLADLAAVMLEYGCVDALNLDGGGSTTVVIGRDGIPSTVNRPTEGAQRKISNAILFVNSDEYLSRSKLTVTPEVSAVLTGGGSQEIKAALGGVAVDASSLTCQLDERAAGSFKNGVFTAGNYVGKVKLTLRTELDGLAISGGAEITIVDRITAASLSASDVKSGEKSPIGLSAALYSASVKVSSGAFSWKAASEPQSGAQVPDAADAIASCGAGYLDSSLVFHAAAGYVGAVTITAERGGVSAEVKFNVLPSDGDKTEDTEAIPPEPSTTDTSKAAFADMSGHWAENAVNAALSLGIISGVKTDAGLYFYPDDGLSRAQLAVMLCGYLKLDVASASSHSFTDAADIPAWELPYINAVIENGIMRGRSGGVSGEITFDALSTVTRAEAMQVLGALVDGGNAAELTAFSDFADIPSWSSDMTAKVVGAGIVRGYADGTLRPLSPVTRAEICVMLVGAFESAAK